MDPLSLAANVRISNLPVVTAASLVDTDILPVVAGIAGGVGVTSNITISELRLKLGTQAPGGGRTVTSAAVYLANNAVFNVKDFGAVGDGNIDDTLAIQNTINAAVLVFGTVFFPAGTYKLNGARQQSCRSNSGVCTLVTDTILVASSNFKMKGEGYASRLKVAGSYSAGGDYRLMAGSTINISNVEISDLVFDSNGANNLVIDSAANLRRAYAINFLSGDNVKIHDCWFEGNPGRNVINLGNNSAGVYDYTNVMIYRNRFRNVGGAIVGNENQSDHSSIYLQADKAQVVNNFFDNDVSPNQFGAPAQHTVNAIEVHGRNTLVAHNIVRQYTHGGVLAAQVHDSSNNQWIHNQFYGITQNVLNIATTAGFFMRKLVIRGNLIEIDNSAFAGGMGIFQNTTSAGTGSALEDIIIEDNHIYGTNSASLAQTWYGIQIVAADGLIIRRNKFRLIQASAIFLGATSVTQFSIRNFDIDGNIIVDSGIHSSASNPWAIFLNHPTVDNREIANGRVRNNYIARLGNATVYTSRGIRTSGVAAGVGGYINNVIFENNIFDGIQRGQRYDFANQTNFTNVGVVSRPIARTNASDPVSGFWHVGVEHVIHNDPVAGGFFGKHVKTSGSAVSATWAISTAYTAGQWIKNSANKVFVCVIAGTSDPATEPTSASLGALVVDGTVTWMYVDTVIAAFAPYGESVIEGSAVFDPASLADGAGATTTVTVIGAALGDYALASFSLDLQGITLTAWVSSTNTVSVRFQNESGGVLDLASGTLKARVRKQ